MTKKKSIKKDMTRKIPMKWILSEDNLCPVPDKVLQQHAEALLEWALTDDDALVLSDYMSGQRISRQTFYTWAARYKPLSDALEQAKHIVGDRREREAIKRKLDGNLVEKMMPLYNPEYRAWKMWLKEKEGEAKANEQKIVIIERFPEIDKKVE